MAFLDLHGLETFKKECDKKYFSSQMGDINVTGGISIQNNGEIRFYHSSLDVTSAPSIDGGYWQGLSFNDKNKRVTGALQVHQSKGSKSVSTFIASYSGDDIGCSLGCYHSNNTSTGGYIVSHPSAFRSAIGINSVSSLSTTSGGKGDIMIQL